MFCCSFKTVAPLSPIESTAFRQWWEEDPALAFCAAFWADAEAAQEHGGLPKTCSDPNFVEDKARAMSHECFESLLEHMRAFWTASMKGLAILPAGDYGQGLFVDDIE